MSRALAEIGSLYDTSSEEDDTAGCDEETSDNKVCKRKVDDMCQFTKRLRTVPSDEQPNVVLPIATATKRRLPLPTELINMFKEKSSSDELTPADDGNHGGRLRSFPHERGNWATHIYVKFDPERFCDDLVQQLLKLSPGLVRANDLHISLSKTIVLRHHWIELFTQSLKNKLQHFKSFFLTFQSLKFYTNEEKTRTFLGLQVDAGNSQLREIVKETDECLTEFKLSTFYEDPSFHVSIAWCVGNKEQELSRTLSVLQKKLREHFDDEHCKPTKVENIHCKTGNRIYKFPLMH